MRCRPRAVVFVVLAIVSALTLPGCTHVAQPASAQRAEAATPTSQPPRPDPPVVLFLGDSYAMGAHGVTPDQTYASETARLLGWQVIVGGHSGTGFVNTGSIGKNFARLFEQQMSWRPAPDMVIVSGGHNDWSYPPRMVGNAVDALLRTIARRWPHTQIVVIGPIWGGDPRPEVLPVRDAIRAAAARRHVPFIDPLQQRWFTGNHALGTGNAVRFILRDGTHPTREGHRHIAELLAEDLRAMGLAEPREGEVTSPRPTPRQGATRRWR